MDERALVGETGLSYERIKKILQNSDEFKKRKSNIETIDAKMISDGKGFLSQVFRISVKFTNPDDREYAFILKIPFPSGLQQIIENGKKNGEDKVVDQIVVDGHNIECEFYEHVKKVKGLPVPKMYAAEKIIIGKQNGLLAMQDLTGVAEPLGFYRSANQNQVLNVATSLAELQFNAQQNEEFSKWWKTLRVTIHLEEIYTKYTDGAMCELSKIPEIQKLLPKIPIVFDQKFGYYCLLDRPEQFNAVSFCHGDFQPNNIMFKLDENGELTDELAGFIDYQLVFSGNQLFDLARFLTFGVDGDVREKVETQAYNVYYTKLRQLYSKNGKVVPFTYQQGFELFELSLCQQVGFIVTFLGIFSMAHGQMQRDVPDNFKMLVDRAKHCIQRGLEIIEKYKLNKIRVKSSL